MKILILLMLVNSPTIAFGLSCPVNYIKVPPSSVYKIPEFCVAKYESKKSNSNWAISTPATAPWTNLTREQAILACKGNGEGFDLISNNQWQALARNIENVASNWSGGEAGKGYLNTGHSFNKPNESVSASADDSTPCINTSFICNKKDWNQHKRTHILSNSEIIWDIAGNSWEFVNDDLDPKILSLVKSDYAPFGQHSRFKELNSPIVLKAIGPAHANITWDQGYGFIAKVDSGRMIARGGNFDDFFMAGIYAAVVGINQEATHPNVGFRCIYK